VASQILEGCTREKLYFSLQAQLPQLKGFSVTLAGILLVFWFFLRSSLLLWKIKRKSVSEASSKA